MASAQQYQCVVAVGCASVWLWTVAKHCGAVVVAERYGAVVAKRCGAVVW